MITALAIIGLATLAEPPVVPMPPASATDPLEVELSFRAPPSCPTSDDIEARIRALLPGEPTGTGVLHVEGEVTITAEGARLVLVSSFRGQTERREMTARRCAELVEATAVLVAIALEPARADEIETAATGEPHDPAAVPDPSPASPDPSSVAAPPSRTDETRSSNDDAIVGDLATLEASRPSSLEDTRPEPASRRRAPFGWALRLAGGLDAGGVPPPTGALQAAALLEWPRARLEVHGVWLVPRTRTDPVGNGAVYQLGAAGARGCGRLFHGALEVPLCVGAEAGAVRGKSTSGTRRVAQGPWLGALVSVGLARAWGRWGIWTAVEGLGRVIGTRFARGRDVVLHEWPVSVRVLVGIELRGSWIRGGRGQ